MNKGAREQTKPMEDVHFAIPSQGEVVPDTVTPGDGRAMMPEVPNLDPTTREGPGEQTARECDQPVGQVSPPGQLFRRSSRVNKGETSKFKDYVTGEEVENL